MTNKELRRIRKSLNLSQAKLARELGASPNAVARWERGERRISNVVALAVMYVKEKKEQEGRELKK
jgi:transcriptional regulator with XRE-family HTH domain